MPNDKKKNEYTPYQNFVNTIAIILIFAFIGFMIFSFITVRGIQKDINAVKTQIEGLQIEQHFEIYADEKNKDSVAEEILKIQNNEGKTDLLSALDIMDSRYSNFQSELSLYLTVFSFIAALVMAVIPILNYKFVNKDQIDNLVNGFNEKITEVNKNVDLKIGVQRKNTDIQNKAILANDQKEYKQGIKILDDLIRMYGDEAYAYLCRFSYNLRNNKFDLAEKDLSIGYAIDKQNLGDNEEAEIKYLFQYALLFAYKGDLAEKAEKSECYIQTIKYLKKVLKHKPQNTGALSMIGDTYRRLGDNEKKESPEADKYYNKALKNSNDTLAIDSEEKLALITKCSVCKYLADIYVKDNVDKAKKFYEDSLYNCQEYLILEPENIIVFNLILSTYNKLGDIANEKKEFYYNRSLEYCEKVLKIDTNNRSILQFKEALTKKIEDLNYSTL